VGWNSRLDALQAAYLNLSLDFIDRRLASRRASARAYRERLPAVGLLPLEAPAGYLENGYCNVCLLDDPDRRARLQQILGERGIGFGNIYPGAMSAQPGAKPHLKGHFGGNRSERLCRSVLNLPLFPYMTQDELDHVVSAVAAWSH
jgi:UDP-2-acetamido-2-deoxy-ribo-hexuluronate aminotransferase